MKRLTNISFPLIAMQFCLLHLPAGESKAVINGSVDSNGAYGAVAFLSSVALANAPCSSVLVAPRVVLTSGHCIAGHALSCTDPATTPIWATFAETDGEWDDWLSFNARSIPVQSFVRSPSLFDLSQCSAGDSYNCGNAKREYIDHSSELVVLYLAADAPPDVTPLPILVHPFVNVSKSAAEVGVFPTLLSWFESDEPVVTTVGYGVGSHPVPLPGMTLSARDYGLQRWVATSTNYGNSFGADSCDTLAGAGTEDGVVVSPKDLTYAHIPEPDNIPRGTQFDKVEHAFSGTGDSGGPILVGAGIGAKNNAPTPLPEPGPGAGYNPNISYVAGAGSVWVVSGDNPATAYTPTWTPAASAFLMSALHDSDGDKYADPVDDDRDDDGCNDDVDQHPDDRWVRIGTILRPNCSPSKAPWYGDESLNSDPDSVPDCMDNNDDNDTFLDFQDNCPVHQSNVCIKFDPPCPWNRNFFACPLADCGDTLVKLSSVINPDPTREVFFRVLSASERLVTLAPAENFSLEQSAKMLAGATIREITARAASRTRILRKKADEGIADTAAAATRGGRGRSLLALEVVSPLGRLGLNTSGGLLAVYTPGHTRVAHLAGANALQVRFAKDGRSVEIAGVKVAPPDVGEGVDRVDGELRSIH